MFSKTFVVAEDDDTGEIGMMPHWIAKANAGQGGLVPHDMFEHAVRARHGASEEEFMAIAAAYRIRGENGFFQRGFYRGSNSGVVANEVNSILTDLSNNERSRFMAKPRTTYKLKDEGAEFVFQSAALKGIQMALGEWRNNWSESATVPTDSEILRDSLAGDYTFNELKALIVGWLRIGYMNVQRRYPKVDLYNLAYLYENIGKTANQVLGVSYPGDKIRVTVDLQRFHFTVRNLAHRLDD